MQHVTSRTRKYKMEYVPSLGVVLLSLTISISASDPLIGSSEMMKMCGKSIDVTSATVLDTRRFDSTSYYSRFCEVHIRAKQFHKIIIHFIERGHSFISMKQICQGHLKIFDGPDIFSPTMAEVSCSSTFLKTLVSRSRDILVYLHRNHININYTEDRGYEVLLIPFHTGKCNDDEYRCNNHRCIDRTLRCNRNYDTCGNESCDTPHRPGEYIVISIILMACIIIITVIGGCCYRWKKRKREQNSRLIQNSTSRRSFEGCGSFSSPVEFSFSPERPPQYDTPSCLPPPYSVCPQRRIHTELEREEGQITHENDPPPPYEENARW